MSDKHLWVCLHPFLAQEEQNASFEVREEEFHYLKNVLRLKEGEELLILDGQGTKGKGRLESFSKKSATLFLSHKETLKKPERPNIKLLVGALKSHHMDDLLSLIPKLCIEEIIVVKAHKSSQTYDEKKVQKWKRTCYETLRLTKWPWQTSISYYPSWEAFKTEPNTHYVLCDENIKDITPLSHLMRQKELLSQNLTFLIGPEGGWTKEEKEGFERLKPLAISLTPHIMSSVVASFYVSSIAVDSFLT
jgi:16S rRNA (uracil1498-N3)-methyltransferase